MEGIPYPKLTTIVGDVSFEFGYFVGGKDVAEISYNQKTFFLRHTTYGEYEVVEALSFDSISKYYRDGSIILHATDFPSSLPNGDFDCEKIANIIREERGKENGEKFCR